MRTEYSTRTHCERNMARGQRLPKDHGDTVKKSHPPSVVRNDIAEINPKRKIMADAILEGATLSEAARVADIHPSHANTVMKNDDIKGYLQQAREEIEDISTMKRCQVLNLFIEAIDMARTLADPAQMINGADKIAKMMGYYAPETKRIELTGDTAVLGNRLRNMSDQDLLEMVSRKRANEAKVIEGTVVGDEE